MTTPVERQSVPRLYEIIHPEGPRISVFRSTEETVLGATFDALSLIQADPTATYLGATGNTYELFWKTFVTESARYNIDLSQARWSHLDNYVWRPTDYPDGPGPEDFKQFMIDRLVRPAGIPENHFIGIDGYTNNPAITAFMHQSWLRNQRVQIAFFGLGPIPEVHLGYMNPNTPMSWGVHRVQLSEATIARNIARGEHVPSEALTIGPTNIVQAKNKIILAFNKPDEIEAALVAPKSPAVVASMIRGLPNVHFYLDMASAKPLEKFRHR